MSIVTVALAYRSCRRLNYEFKFASSEYVNISVVADQNRNYFAKVGTRGTGDRRGLDGDIEFTFNVTFKDCMV